MTVSSTTVKNSYSGNSSTTVFAYSFKIFADSDLQVIIRSSTGAETTKTLTTHYTVSGAGDASGGNVTFTSGNTPATGETVVIRRGVPQTQAIDYIANDPFPAESHEEGLDRATMTTQQVQEELDRSIKLSRTNTMTSTEFTVGATDRANKILAFDSSGEISVTQELGTFKGSDATVTTAAYVQRDIIKSTTAAQLNNVYICVADSVVGDSLTDTDHFELLVDAVSAASSATAAASSATASASSATSSASSATTSGNSATASASSATAAASSATAAATSATEAAASADAFDDIYLGSKSSDPSTDNDGDALAAGMLYFNTTSDVLRVYSGSAWQDAAISSTGVVTLTGTQTLTNKTLTAPKINEDVAVTSTATELNLLDGVSGLVQADFTKLAAVTSTATELNILDGATVVVGEVNALDLGGTGTGTAIASKAVVLDGNKDYTGIRNVSLTGTLGVAGISSFAVAANVAQSALTSSSNAVAWDASAKPNAYHLTTENTTFSAPSNAVEGAFIALEINYNGSHTIAFNTVFEFAASTAPTFTSTDGKTDILVFRYNGAVWQEVGRTLNLSES
jgi:hypothetical protein